MNNAIALKEPRVTTMLKGSLKRTKERNKREKRVRSQHFWRSIDVPANVIPIPKGKDKKVNPKSIKLELDVLNI